MAQLDTLLASNRAATEELLAVASRDASRWNAARAPGKWSPAQITEHVARTFEEGANAIAERPTKLPNVPRILKPVAAWVFRRTLRTGKFPKAKTTRALNPEVTPSSPASPVEARSRLEAAQAAFERECRARAGRTFAHAAFGVVSVEDYVRFTELHTRHHTRQIPSSLVS